ncbi:MAG: 3-methyl-2-oxobutanoate hydroxymethyltransferase [Pseudomonadota bacterium]
MSKTINLADLRRMKAQQEKIVCLTAYDASFARLFSQNGIELLLIGDSLGNVIQGHDTVVPVNVADILYHTRIVVRGNTGSYLMADLPFMAYTNETMAIANAKKLMQAGAHCIKLEVKTQHLTVVKALADAGVPVCVHIGLSAQVVHQQGGYKIQGRSKIAAEQLLNDAIAFEQAGACLCLIECVPAALAKTITTSLNIPTIGIGAGVDCDGQILVSYDILGIDCGFKPKFVSNFLEDLPKASIKDAVIAYRQAVKKQFFPAPVHCFAD